jgi:pyruvate/2-oxoglutarate dehydrogenase complex dihydrolipoamide acyltransferase (E2) component
MGSSVAHHGETHGLGGRPLTSNRVSEPDFHVVSVPLAQRQIDDWLAAAARRHTMHALLELDITDARRAIRERRAETGEPLSFTAFVVACLARAIDEDKTMHAHRKGRHELVLFDDVDVTVVVERWVEGARVPVPHIVRAANRKSSTEITREIQAAATGSLGYARARRLLPVWLRVPASIRRAVWSRWLADPHRRKRLTGTTFVSAVGMFGHGTAWGMPQAQNYTLGLTVGGIARKPAVVRTADGERIEPREFVCLTLSFDHEIVEGAPAARFTARLKELMEGAAVLAGPLLDDDGDGASRSAPGESRAAVAARGAAVPR